jgi:hypothetical protein
MGPYTHAAVVKAVADAYLDGARQIAKWRMLLAIHPEDEAYRAHRDRQVARCAELAEFLFRAGVPLPKMKDGAK